MHFFEAIDPFLRSLDSDVIIGFMDDITLSRELNAVEGDIEAILKLSHAKCEIIMEDFSRIDSSSMFKYFIRVEKNDMTLLGSL